MLGLMSERPLLVSADHQACGRVITGIPKSSREPSKGAIHRYTYADAERRSRQLAQALLRLGDPAGRSGWHARLEHLSPFRALLRHFGHRCGLPHDQSAAIRGTDRLHHQPCGRSAAVCRSELSAADRAARSEAAGRLPDRSVDRSTDAGPESQLSRRCQAMKSWSPQRTMISSGRNLTNGPLLRFATPREPPATQRARSSATARRCCTPIGISLPDAISISALDVVCPVVPMFHAMRLGHPLRRADERREARIARAAARRAEPL